MKTPELAAWGGAGCSCYPSRAYDEVTRAPGPAGGDVVAIPPGLMTSRSATVSTATLRLCCYPFRAYDEWDTLVEEFAGWWLLSLQGL